MEKGDFILKFTCNNPKYLDPSVPKIRSMLPPCARFFGCLSIFVRLIGISVRFAPVISVQTVPLGGTQLIANS